MSPSRKDDDEDSNESAGVPNFAAQAFWPVVGFVSILIGIIYQGLNSKVEALADAVIKNAVDIAVIQSQIPSFKREP